jgi:hypothetical protein
LLGAGVGAAALAPAPMPLANPVQIVAKTLPIINGLVSSSVASTDSAEFEAEPEPPALTYLFNFTNSLVPNGTTGLFWGTVFKNVTDQMCTAPDIRSDSVPANITAYDQTYTTTLTVDQVIGCGNTSNTTGVQALVTDQMDQQQVLVVCNQTQKECPVFLIGVPEAEPESEVASIDSADIAGGPGGDSPFWQRVGPTAGLCPYVAFGATFRANPGLAGPALATCVGVVGISTAASSGCFPGHALALTRDGQPVRMSNIQLGQDVAVRKGDGSIGFEPVYTFGHRDAASFAAYIRLTMSACVLDLTPGHFIPVQRGTGKLAYMRAKDVAVGDYVMVMSANDTTGTVAERVMAVAGHSFQGMLNPFTLSGTILVNNVVASAHSEWFADSVVDMLGMSPWFLPTLYQAALAPVRWAWYLLGSEKYVSAYQRLDADLDFASLGSGKASGYLKIIYAVMRGVGSGLMASAV